MPRLPFWGFSAVTTAGVSYAGYHFVYEPHHAAQLHEELRLTHSKQQHQDVIHAYSRLRTKLEVQLSSPNSSTGGAATSAVNAWYTNAEKIVFFCDIQLIRRLLSSLPHHLTTEKDLDRMYSELTRWEKQYCTELHFRDAPLLFTQTLRCVSCYTLYMLVFRVVAPLLNVWNGLGSPQTRLLHYTARFIIQALEIDVVMVSSTAMPTFKDKRRCEYASNEKSRSLDGSLNETEKSVNTQCSVPIQYVTLSPTHWIEEVGFWACTNNPLLAQHMEDEKGTQANANERNRTSAVMRLLCSPGFTNAAFDSSATVTYAQYWRQEAAETLARENASDASSPLGSTLPPSSASLVAVTAEEVSLGYPVVTNTASMTAMAENDAVSSSVCYIPVGVSGLPHVLYVDAAHAVTDTRPRRTREQVYAHLQQAQLTRSPPADNTKMTEFEETPTKASTTKTVSSSLTKLQRWRSCGSIPMWQRAWWGGVYGGSRQASASTTSCTLWFYVGAPCTATNFITESIEASRAAEVLPQLGH